MRRVVALAIAGVLLVMGACTATRDVEVTDERPLDSRETDDTSDTSGAPGTDTTEGPDISTPDTVGPDVTVSVPDRTTSPPDTVSPDPTTGDEDSGGEVDPDDVELILELWSGYDAAAGESVEAKVAYVVDRSYPGLELSEELCAEDPTAPGYVPLAAVELDETSITPDPEWVIRIANSPVDGQTPDGTIYVHDITLTYEDGSTETSPAHTTILDGVAYFFFDCGG